MDEATEFERLVMRVRAGDADAAAELMTSYRPQIQRIVRVRMTDPRLRRQLDSLDICQSVFADFFLRVAMGQYDVGSPTQLIQLLATMARRRVIHHARKQRAARRDMRRVEAADVRDIGLAERIESPSQIICARELVELFQSRLNEVERTLVEQRREGRSWEEIAALHGRASEAMRKQHQRALERVSRELGLELSTDD